MAPDSVPASGIMRTLQVGDQPTRLAQAIAEYGRIDKTLHTLRYIDDGGKRRGTLIQLNRGEARHSVARAVFHGKRGELRQHYREGQEGCGFSPSFPVGVISCRRFPGFSSLPFPLRRARFFVVGCPRCSLPCPVVFLPSRFYGLDAAWMVLR
jgi:hypothetical protein